MDIKYLTWLCFFFMDYVRANKEKMVVIWIKFSINANDGLPSGKTICINCKITHPLDDASYTESLRSGRPQRRSGHAPTGWATLSWCRSSSRMLPMGSGGRAWTDFLPSCSLLVRFGKNTTNLMSQYTKLNFIVLLYFNVLVMTWSPFRIYLWLQTNSDITHW